jgi:hypothetical protein
LIYKKPNTHKSSGFSAGNLPALITDKRNKAINKTPENIGDTNKCALNK